MPLEGWRVSRATNGAGEGQQAGARLPSGFVRNVLHVCAAVKCSEGYLLGSAVRTVCPAQEALAMRA